MAADAYGLMPDVRQAQDEDLPRMARLTLRSLLGFFVFAGLWAHFALSAPLLLARQLAANSARAKKETPRTT